MPTADSSQPIKAPPTFQDGAKPPRTWTIDLNLDLCDTVNANAQVDLIPDDNDVTQVVGLLCARKKLGGVLWECCQEQAAAKGVDRKSFLAGLDGNALARGWGALVDGIRFFIQSQSPKQAEQFEAMVEAAMRVVELGADEIAKTIKSEATQKGIQAAVDEFAKTLPIQMQEALENCVTSAPASSESILDRVRSGNS